MAFRTNIQVIFKTFRFDPELVEDMERILYLATSGDKPKYRSMTELVKVAISKLIMEERRILEDEGVAWDHLKPGFKQSLTKQGDGNSE